MMVQTTLVHAASSPYLAMCSLARRHAVSSSGLAHPIANWLLGSLSHQSLPTGA